jgi:hypothetical protein
MTMPQPRRDRACQSQGGQAITETILTTWVLVMVLAVILQVFLIDQHAYRLATKAHALLFTQVAYPDNKPTVKYETRWTQKFEGEDEYVPVIGFFQMYGLTREDLRIRTIHGRPGGFKRIKLGRGTLASVSDGVAGAADPSAYLSQIADGLQQLDVAKNRAQEAQNAGAGKGGRR